MLERRRHDRRRAFSAGTMGYGRRGDAIDCVVRDLSDGGALLLVDEPQRAPIRLVLASRGDARPARVVWRGPGGVGVAFEPAAARSTVVSLDEARRARAGDGGRLAERVARFVGRTGPTDSALSAAP